MKICSTNEALHLSISNKYFLLECISYNTVSYSYCITGKCSIIIDASRTITVVPKLVSTYSSYIEKAGWRSDQRSIHSHDCFPKQRPI